MLYLYHEKLIVLMIYIILRVYVIYEVVTVVCKNCRHDVENSFSFWTLSLTQTVLISLALPNL
jgi:hypothetical protein